MPTRPPISEPSALNGSTEHPLCADTKLSPERSSRLTSSVMLYIRKDADFFPGPPGAVPVPGGIDASLDGVELRFFNDQRTIGQPLGRLCASRQRCDGGVAVIGFDEDKAAGADRSTKCNEDRKIVLLSAVTNGGKDVACGIESGIG